MDENVQRDGRKRPKYCGDSSNAQPVFARLHLVTLLTLLHTVLHTVLHTIEPPKYTSAHACRSQRLNFALTKAKYSSYDREINSGEQNVEDQVG